MIGVPRGVTVYACGESCDMRKSFDRLSAVVSNSMRLDLLTGDLFLFVSKDRKRAKVLYLDGTGMCLFAKRLDQEKFVALWKRHRTGKELTLTLSELGLFIEEATALRAPLSPPLIRRADLRVENELIWNGPLMQLMKCERLIRSRDVTRAERIAIKAN